jgi:hypothetical protein
MKSSLIHLSLPVDGVDSEVHSKGSRFQFKHLLMVPLRLLLDKLAPIGYQDEEGFHYGAKEDSNRHI